MAASTRDDFHAATSWQCRPSPAKMIIDQAENMSCVIGHAIFDLGSIDVIGPMLLGRRQHILSSSPDAGANLQSDVDYAHSSIMLPIPAR